MTVCTGVSRPGGTLTKVLISRTIPEVEATPPIWSMSSSTSRGYLSRGDSSMRTRLPQRMNAVRGTIDGDALKMKVVRGTVDADKRTDDVSGKVEVLVLSPIIGRKDFFGHSDIVGDERRILRYVGHSFDGSLVREMEVEDTVEVNEGVRYDISAQRSGEVRVPRVRILRLRWDLVCSSLGVLK